MTDPGTPPPATPDAGAQPAATPQPAAQQPAAAPQPGYAAPPQVYPAPGQGYGAPGQGYPAPGQGYATPGQGYGPGWAASARPAGNGRGLGIAALIVGLAPVLLGGIEAFFIQAAYRSLGYASVEAVLLVTSVLTLLLAAGAIVMGALAVRRAGGAVLGGIGIGLGGAAALGVILSFLTSLTLYV
jgi:hypothetical protein